MRWLSCSCRTWRYRRGRGKGEMAHYKQQSGPPWMNTFAVAERWLHEQESKRLNIGNIERPNTKWVFVKFSNIEVTVVLDNQPMLRTGPLPDCRAAQPCMRACVKKWFRWILLTITSASGAASFCSPWCPTWSKHTNCEKARKELLQFQNGTKQHPKNVTWWTGKDQKALQSGVTAFRLVRRQSLWARAPLTWKEQSSR